MALPIGDLYGTGADSETGYDGPRLRELVFRGREALP